MTLRTETVVAVLVLLSLTPVPPGWASSLKMNDFAHGVRLVTSTRPGLVRLDLPKRIYRDLEDGEGGDIRVFTMDGRMTPHLLRRPGNAAAGAPALFFQTEVDQVYILAYGSPHARPLPPSHELTRRVASAGPRSTTVRLGPRIDLGGPDPEHGSPGAPSGRMVSLGSLMLGCVLLLAFFAWWTVRRKLR